MARDAGAVCPEKITANGNATLQDNEHNEQAA
jgi:hypothetical protein